MTATLGQELRELRARLRTQLIKLYSSGEYTHEEIVKMTGCNYGTVFKFYECWKDRCEFPAVKHGNMGRPRKDGR